MTPISSPRSRLATVMLTVRQMSTKFGSITLYITELAIPPPVDDPGPVQDVEMSRDVGLCQANLFHDFVDGTLLGAQAGQNAQTRRIGQQSEVMRHLLEHL
jgi:hypothetical protein